MELLARICASVGLGGPGDRPVYSGTFDCMGAPLIPIFFFAFFKRSITQAWVKGKWKTLVVGEERKSAM